MDTRRSGPRKLDTRCDWRASHHTRKVVEILGNWRIERWERCWVDIGVDSPTRGDEVWRSEEVTPYGLRLPYPTSVYRRHDID